MSDPSYASDAWLLEGVTRSLPGWLEWRNERLRFVTAERVVFDVSRSDITDIRYPWYYFGGGVKLRASGTPHRLSFVRPNGAEHAVGRALGEMGNPASLAVAAVKVFDIRSGRAVGRTWRRILSEEPA